MTDPNPATAPAPPATDAAAAASTPAASAPSNLVVHHLDDSRSQRILWLLEELQVPYTIKQYKRVERRAPKELQAVHPLGKSPLITDNGKTIAESGAIVDYLIRKYGNGRLVPTGEDDKQEDVFWSHFAEGSCMNWLVMKLIFTVVPTRAPFLVRPFISAIFGGVAKQTTDPELAKLTKFIADELKKKNGGWLAGGDKDGNPTAADFQMMFVVEAMASGRVPNIPTEITAYVKKIHDRPAWKAGLEKGGPYSFAGKL